MPAYRLTPPPRPLPPMASAALGAFSAQAAASTATSLIHALPPQPPSGRPYTLPYVQGGHLGVLSAQSAPVVAASFLGKVPPLPPTTRQLTVPRYLLMQRVLVLAVVAGTAAAHEPEIGGWPELIEAIIDVMRIEDVMPVGVFDDGLILRLPR